VSSALGALFKTKYGCHVICLFVQIFTFENGKFSVEVVPID